MKVTLVPVPIRKKRTVSPHLLVWYSFKSAVLLFQILTSFIQFCRKNSTSNSAISRGNSYPFNHFKINYSPLTPKLRWSTLSTMVHSLGCCRICACRSQAGKAYCRMTALALHSPSWARCDPSGFQPTLMDIVMRAWPRNVHCSSNEFSQTALVPPIKIQKSMLCRPYTKCIAFFTTKNANVASCGCFNVPATAVKFQMSCFVLITMSGNILDCTLDSLLSTSGLLDLSKSIYSGCAQVSEQESGQAPASLFSWIYLACFGTSGLKATTDCFGSGQAFHSRPVLWLTIEG